MYLNLCNAKFSRIDVEKRVYKEVILSLHFSIASFNMTRHPRVLYSHTDDAQFNCKKWGLLLGVIL